MGLYCEGNENFYFYGVEKMRKSILCVQFLFIAGFACAALTGVSGPLSNMGESAEIIAAPADALDDIATNMGMQGFDEAQDVVTTTAYQMDNGEVLAAGMLVDSHMLFLNSEGETHVTHADVQWTFDGIILGVMSDADGEFEAASTGELGAPGTNYTSPFSGSGPAAPFPLRGFEPFGIDDYIISGDTITVSMGVLEPGDWIRVVTAVHPVPVPGALLLASIGIVVAGRFQKK